MRDKYDDIDDFIDAVGDILLEAGVIIISLLYLTVVICGS